LLEKIVVEKITRPSDENQGVALLKKVTENFFEEKKLEKSLYS